MKVADLGPNRAIVSDHAVLRFLERVYGVDVELVRHEIAAATARGREAARIEGLTRFDVVIRHVNFVVEGGVVVTTLIRGRRRAAKIARRRR